MKIDYLLVAPGIEFERPETHPTWAVAEGLVRRGFAAAVLTSHDAPPPRSDIPSFRLDYPRRVAAGERWGRDAAARHGVSNLRHMAYCEYSYRQDDLEPKSLALLMEEAAAAFEVVEAFFREHEVGCVVHTWMGGEILRQVVARMAAERGIPSLWQSTYMYFPGRVLFVRDGYMTLPGRPTVRFAELAPAQQEDVRSLVEWYRTTRPVRLAAQNRRTFGRLARAFVSERKFMDVRRIRKGWQRTMTFLAYAWGKRWLRQPDWTKKYIYFPLHWPGESEMLVVNPKCEDQAMLCAYMARVLPQDMELWVKPHIANPAEGTPYAVLKTLGRLGNVRVVPPETNTWDILNKASAVVTVFGTTGFQALMLRKPVVVLGSPAYSGWGVTQDVKDLNDFPGMLEQAFRSAITEEQMLDFLASLLSIHVPGDWSKPPYDADVLAAGVIEMSRRCGIGAA